MGKRPPKAFRSWPRDRALSDPERPMPVEARTPGTAVGLYGMIATNPPAGLIVSGVSKHRGEKTGSSKVGGRARQIAKGIAGVLEKRFKEQGWIR